MLIKAGSVLIVPRNAREPGRRDQPLGGPRPVEPGAGDRHAPHHGQGRPQRFGGQHRAPPQAQAPSNVAEWNDVKPNHAFKRGFSVVVYLPVRAAPAARVGAGVAVARGHAAAAPAKRGGAPAQAGTARGKNVVKVPAGKQVVREKRGGTPAKKKR
jgi:membrane-bound lytic murein transglycosylase D